MPGEGSLTNSLRGHPWGDQPEAQLCPQFPPRSQPCLLPAAPQALPLPRLFLKPNFLENRVAHSKDNWSRLGLGGAQDLGPCRRQPGWQEWVQEPPGCLVPELKSKAPEGISESRWAHGWWGPGGGERRPLEGASRCVSRQNPVSGVLATSCPCFSPCSAHPCL